jgi:hypothetical protein
MKLVFISVHIQTATATAKAQSGKKTVQENYYGAEKTQGVAC